MVIFFNVKGIMDTKEQIRKCRAITLAGDREGNVSFKSNMDAKGEQIVAGCLVGKVLTNRTMNKEGIKSGAFGSHSVFVQVWD